MTSHLPRLLCALAALSFITPLATAQSEPYTWKNVTVGAGGFIPGIVFSPVEKGLVYLRSDMGGCYRWDDAQKTWIPLNDALAESSYMGGESIAPDPVDANVVYVAAGMYRDNPAAMLRSEDRGKNWQVFPVTFRMGGNEDGRGVGERLAIDPNDTHILFFGSRHDGLMRSDDKAATWTKVSSFPLSGRGLPDRGQPTNAGLSFVVFDPRSGGKDVASKTIFVGSADPGPLHLFRTDDAGQTWKAVTGGPGSELLPLKAEIDNRGLLYITYGNGAGPNGVTKGAVFVLDTQSGHWTDITPEKNKDHAGGFCGISIDREHPGTIAVSTLNRWRPTDTVWRTTDGGGTWSDIAAKSQRDVSASPFLLWGNPQARLGWWMAALAIDPFDSDHAVYATGATVFATDDFSNVNKGSATHWFPWIHGIEQTAIVTLMSPTQGPHLVSGFGDIGGFVHNDLDQSPPQGMFENPHFGTTAELDYAGGQPNVMVRAQHGDEASATLAVTDDAGQHWEPVAFPQSAGVAKHSHGRDSDHGIAVSADGKNILIASPSPMITADRGRTWQPIEGLPADGKPIADRVDPNIFYCINSDADQFYISSDGGKTFSSQPAEGLSQQHGGERSRRSRSQAVLLSVPGKPGELWIVEKPALLHSIDGGKTFRTIKSELEIESISFGKAPSGEDEPALFAIGNAHGMRAIWRSDDSGQTWKRINDDQHEWGRRFRCIAGDPRIFGRVYVGTDGRGVLYGDPSESMEMPSSSK